jgi:chemotaxis protein MotB
VSAGGHGRRRAKKHEEEEHENHERWLVSYADMVTLLMCLFIVLYAISQVDKAKFAALASGLSSSFGAPITAEDSNATGSSASVLQGLPSPVDIAAGVGQTKTSEGLSQQQVNAAAAQAALQRAANVQAEAKDAYSQLAAARDAINKALTAAGDQNSVSYTIDERGLVVHVIADNVLFAEGAAALQPAGGTLLDAVAPTLTSLPNQLRVEGHTNKNPTDPTGPWPSNWELSAYRATTVLRYLAGDGIPDTRMSAADYADTQPLVPYTNPNAMALNRRVDIVVLSTASQAANDQLAALDAAAAQKGAK